ncbi:MAG: cyclopropane-fatty-acyl-phospholipid synthase family protein [Proteobacteria bacterium]|nr:cyclopropane-fatty-acyl-phospholipid synthase family protein [Pseudomonadota bacterium]
MAERARERSPLQFPGLELAKGLAVAACERGWVPDVAVRAGIRRLLRERLAELRSGDLDTERRELERFVDELRNGPVAIHTDSANQQHYEVPAAFFRAVLGSRLKYSCAHFADGADSLDLAEEAMLALCCERARVGDGMSILDLGCGWGSLSLFLAERYPRARIVAVSNSKDQRESILKDCQERGIENLEVVRADAQTFEPARRFDRVMSVEMFEHMRNWETLFGRIRRWLEPDGKFFLHVFCHRRFAYPYEDRGDGDWMSRHFFTGGIMPCDDLAHRMAGPLRVASHWRVAGQHYQKTADAWLAKLDAARDSLEPVLAETYGADGAELGYRRWRLFFLACSELFGFADGREWYVSHYLLEPKQQPQAAS